tara:strand:+ start:1010 stop:1252 length:243 start_codon:yes stop_codon:yes gene_type:complete
MNLMSTRTIDGWKFKLIDNGDGDQFYECRGAVMYDDEHDQIPEPSLWQAAEKLEKWLSEDGFKSEAGHSEKGWVEVTIMD